MIRIVLAIGLVVALAVGCGDDDDEGGATATSTQDSATATSTTAPFTATATTPPDTVTATATAKPPVVGGSTVIYLLMDQPEGGPFLVPVARPAAGSVAETMGLLLKGPTDDEASGIPEISTAIPAGTANPGGTNNNGLMTVEMNAAFEAGGGSFSMLARLGQVVLTLTALEEVDAVLFTVDGEPVDVFSSEGIDVSEPQTADDYTPVMPPVMITSPVWGGGVRSPLVVEGHVAPGIETVRVVVTDDDGLIVAEQDAGTLEDGARRSFSMAFDVDVEPGRGAVIAWQPGAADEQQHVREHPVIFR